MKKITFILLLMVAMVTTAMAQATETKVELTTVEGQPGYISSPHDHAIINPNSQWDMGGVAAMIDGDVNTHFHTAWENVPAGPHYFQIDMGDGYAIGQFRFDYVARNNGHDDFAREFTIKGSNNGADFELITVVDFGEYIQAGSSHSSTVLGTEENRYRYLRFEVTNTKMQPQYSFRTYFHVAEFALYAIGEINTELTPERTITVATNNNEAGNVTVNGVANEATAEGAITLQATANAGYVFEGWLLNGEMVSSNTTYVDNTEGNKEYVANFRKLSSEEIYAAIAKPLFAKAGNTTFAEYATISNGNGIENHSENIIPAELAVQGQNGRTDFIEVEAGATFNLDITYVFNWGDITIVKIENGAAEIVYGSFKGEWPNFTEEVVKESMSNAGLAVNEKTVTYPIALSNDLKEGEMVVIRTVTAGNFDLNKQDAYSEGSYMDFVFVVKAEGENTAIENVNVETANDVIYDITGRRVKEITNAGIYIINGKKTFVK